MAKFRLISSDEAGDAVHPCSACGKPIIRNPRSWERWQAMGYRNAFCNAQCRGSWLGRNFGFRKQE